MSVFPIIPYRFDVDTGSAGHVIATFEETEWDIPAAVILDGLDAGKSELQGYIGRFGIGMQGYAISLERVSPMDLHACLLANDQHKSDAISGFEVFGYVPESMPTDEEMDRLTEFDPDYADDDEGDDDSILEAATADGIDRPKTICVDFDGVIADYSQGYQGTDVFGDPLPGAAEAMQALKDAQWKIIIFTTRPNTLALRKYLQDNGIVWDEINMNTMQPEGANPGKPIADIYLDDRAVRFKDWFSALNAIQALTNEMVLEAANDRTDVQKRLADMLSSGEFDNVDFGRLKPSKLAKINAIREGLNQPVLQSGHLIIPKNVVAKLHEKRILKDGMSADDVADLLFSIFHSRKTKVVTSKHDHIQMLINAREDLSRIGFIGMSGDEDTVIKSGYKMGTKRVGKQTGKGKTTVEGRPTPSSGTNGILESAADRPRQPGRLTDHHGGVDERSKPRQGEESKSSFNAAPTEINIPSTTIKVKNEDIVTEAASYDYRTALVAAKSFDDIATVFSELWPELFSAKSIIPFKRGTVPPKKDGVYELKNGKYARYEQGQWYFAFDDREEAAITTRQAGYMSPQFRIHEAYQWREIQDTKMDILPSTLFLNTLQTQGFKMDTNIDGEIISLRKNGNIALRNRSGAWKLYCGEISEKNLIGDDYTLDEVVSDMDTILESASLAGLPKGNTKINTDNGETTIALLLRRISKAKGSQKDTIYLSTYGDDRRILLEMAILKLSPGVYTLTIEGRAAPSLRSAIESLYGVHAGTDVNERLIMGMTVKYSKVIQASFTHGLQEIRIGTDTILESTAPTAEEIHDIAHEAATSHKNDLPEPTEAQAKAGNYKKGRIRLHGLDITIENPAGSTRSGVDPDGKPWSCTLPAHYGDLKRTEGADGDAVDCYIGEHPEGERVFVVDQMDLMTGCFDEHKVVLAAQDEDEARKIYVAGFSDGKGPDRIGAITKMSIDEFKAWLAEGDTTQPVGRIEPK